MTLPKALYVIGAGGLAKEMAQLAFQVDRGGDRWSFQGFVSGNPDEVDRDLGLGRVLGDDAWLLERARTADLVIAIGSPAIRERVVKRFLGEGERFAFPNLVHPTALVDLQSITFGQGNAVTAGCIFTCDIQVGDFNLFNLQTTVGHDARIGSFNVINPSVNVSGGVRLGDRILIGTGAQVLENRVIGDGATVGAGAVVTKDVEADSTVVGIPAKSLERRG